MNYGLNDPPADEDDVYSGGSSPLTPLTWVLFGIGGEVAGGVFYGLGLQDGDATAIVVLGLIVMALASIALLIGCVAMGVVAGLRHVGFTPRQGGVDDAGENTP